MKLYDVIRKEKLHEPDTEEQLEKEEVLIKEEHPYKKRKRLIIIGGILSFLTLLYIGGSFIVRARVFIEERTIPFTLENETVELLHETKSDPERLSFQTVVVTSQISREVFGSELKDVTGKAKGMVVFFNEYSKGSISLKSGTTLTATNGKTYTTNTSVTIPGYKMDGKKKIAGTSPSVAITATGTGSAWNSEGTSLSVSAYSGTKKTQIYARSVGGLSGGDSGMNHTVKASERAQVIETLKTQLTERLRRETRAQIPSNLLAYPDLQFISIDTDSIKLEGEGIRFPASIKGTMVSYLIPRDLFETTIARKALSDHSYTLVSIPQIANLSVSAESAIPADPKIVPDNITISISGEGSIITEIPPEKIKDALLGLKRGSFNNAVGAIPEIASARFKLFPFWAPFFPKKEDFIKVTFKQAVDL